MVSATGSASPSRPASAPFHIMVKPIGPLCNLDCQYCFYLEKEALFPSNERFRMSDEVLEAFVRKYIEAQPNDTVTFAWQGGEPTLMGVPFFEKAVALQKKYAAGKQIDNAFQTNGTLLDDRWAEFLKENRFLVGVSIDGPQELHDAYRVDKQGGGTWEKVMRGIRVLQKHGVDFNTLTVVNRLNSQKPLDVYRFLRETGSNFLQFIPLVERRANEAAAKLGLELSTPPVLSAAASEDPVRDVTDWSVRPEDFGNFLCRIFDRWVTRDVGKVYVQAFDGAFAKWLGVPGGICVHNEECGRALALEHTGELYACDHFVYPDYRRGNLATEDLVDLVDGTDQEQFGRDKNAALPGQCRRCPVRFACHGGCPKHRFLTTRDGDPGLNYLCRGYKQFFTHIDRPMSAMAQLYQAGRPPAMVMDLLKRKVTLPSRLESSRADRHLRQRK